MNFRRRRTKSAASWDGIQGLAGILSAFIWCPQSPGQKGLQGLHLSYRVSQFVRLCEKMSGKTRLVSSRLFHSSNTRSFNILSHVALPGWLPRV